MCDKIYKNFTLIQLRPSFSPSELTKMNVVVKRIVYEHWCQCTQTKSPLHSYLNNEGKINFFRENLALLAILMHSSYSTGNINLYISILSYHACILSYRAFILSYGACILSGFAFILSWKPFIRFCVYRVSGFAFILWIGIPRHFHEQINEKPRDLLHFVIIVGLLNIAEFLFAVTICICFLKLKNYQYYYNFNLIHSLWLHF